VLPRFPRAHIPPSLPRWHRRVLSSLTSPTITAFPVLWPGRLPHQPFRGLHNVRYRCSLHARQITQGDPLHRRLRPLRFLHDRSDCYRLERELPGGFKLNPLRNRAFSRRTTKTGTLNYSPVPWLPATTLPTANDGGALPAPPRPGAGSTGHRSRSARVFADSYRRSKRSRFITLVQAVTNSCRNCSCASELP